MKLPKPPPTTGPDRVMPVESHYADKDSYEDAMAEWWKDVEDNPRPMDFGQPKAPMNPPKAAR